MTVFHSAGMKASLTVPKMAASMAVSKDGCWAVQMAETTADERVAMKAAQTAVLMGHHSAEQKATRSAGKKAKYSAGTKAALMVPLTAVRRAASMVSS